MKLRISSHIQTERLNLNRIRYEDAEEIFYTYASKPAATRYMSWPTHESIRDTRLFVQDSVTGWNSGTDYSFTIRLKETNRLVGSWGMINKEGKIQFCFEIFFSILLP